MFTKTPSPRLRRLQNDLKAMGKLSGDSSILDFSAEGGAEGSPDVYQVRFAGRGFWRPDHNSEVLIRQLHHVTIKLGASYPRMMPELHWRTPIFHPNISAGGVVCLGGYGTHWVPSLSLDSLCVMLWDMIRYENFDTESPYNREAAQWATVQSDYLLPVDTRPLRDKLSAPAGNPLTKPPSVATSSPPTGSRPSDFRAAPIGASEVTFLSDVVDAELIDEPGSADDSDILFIE